MTKEFKDPKLGGILRLNDEGSSVFSPASKSLPLIHIVWNKNTSPIEILVDSIPIQLEQNQVTTITYLQKVSLPKHSPPFTCFSFNREFYCIHDHDHEVSCNGIIFFGTQEIPIVTLNEAEAQKFELLYQVFLDEFSTHDAIQGEMLRMLLKRLIIKTTRLAKEQLKIKVLGQGQVDTVRKFNTLVDFHYKTKKHVSDYADMLHKSPKTLSNLFAKYNHKSPLAIIHERIVLEAKRLLLYSDHTAKEVAFELGFEETASFHKMFKKITQKTPNQFKKEAKTLK